MELRLARSYTDDWRSWKEQSNWPRPLDCKCNRRTKKRRRRFKTSPFRNDTTSAVDWALKANYLSIYPKRFTRERKGLFRILYSEVSYNSAVIKAAGDARKHWLTPGPWNSSSFSYIYIYIIYCTPDAERHWDVNLIGLFTRGLEHFRQRLSLAKFLRLHQVCYIMTLKCYFCLCLLLQLWHNMIYFLNLSMVLLKSFLNFVVFAGVCVYVCVHARARVRACVCVVFSGLSVWLLAIVFCFQCLKGLWTL